MQIININYFWILILTFYLGCNYPSDPIDAFTIINRLVTINTGGNCLDLDLDISDSIIVAAANYNGYFTYKIIFNGEIISGVTVQNHVSADEMDNSLGDNRAQTVVLSKNHNIAFVMDQYDHIWLYKYEDGAVQYGPPNYLDEDCYGGTWLSAALDDQADRVRIFTLLKHNAAEFMPYCISEENFQSIGTDQGCSDIMDIIETEYNDEFSCEGEGFIWISAGCQVGNYAEYSTSLVWKNLEEVDPSSTSLEGEPDCEYIINQATVAEKIFFADSLLTLAYGELGTRIFKQAANNTCMADIDGNLEIISLDENAFCIANYPDDTSGKKTCCENDICGLGLGECPWFEDGYGGRFTSAGGILPNLLAEFDTPGEVNAIYSVGNTIFTGLAYSNGCLMNTLDYNGLIISNHQFADGYTIKGLHHDDGLLALAAGHDGILLFDWNESIIAFKGKIETAYANNVKVANNTIFAATEDGIEIIQIER